MDLSLRSGVRLGWQVDPFNQQVWIHRPNAEPVLLDRPEELSDDDVLPSHTVTLRRIWRPE